MSLRLRDRLETQQRLDQGVGRRLARVALLAAILVLAWVQGYTTRGWILIGLLVLWAASLPFLLSWLGRRLAGVEALSSGQRRVLLIAAAILLLGVFAICAMLWLRLSPQQGP